MTATPGSLIFVDTNILVYASFPTTPLHGAAVARLAELDRAGMYFCTSRQVLREYLASASRPGNIFPMPSHRDLVLAVAQFENLLEVVGEDDQVTAILCSLVASRQVSGKQVHDANIVATLLRYQIPLLLTHNTADFSRYTPDIGVLPLLP